LLARLRLFNRYDGRIMALLSVSESDGRRDLGAGHVLKKFKVLFGGIFLAGSLQCAGKRKLRGSVERLNG